MIAASSAETDGLQGKSPARLSGLTPASRRVGIPNRRCGSTVAWHDFGIGENQTRFIFDRATVIGGPRAQERHCSLIEIWDLQLGHFEISNFSHCLYDILGFVPKQGVVRPRRTSK
jgi:hypothetical protein